MIQATVFVKDFNCFEFSGRTTDGIELLGIKGQRRFQANVTLPLGDEIVDVAESFTLMQAKGVEPDVLSVGSVMAEIFAEDVESIEMFVTPLEAGLEHTMEWSQCRVASDQESPPDERTDVSKDNTQLIDVGGRFVAVS